MHWLVCFLPSISIHALLAESDRPCVLNSVAVDGFLSTLSLRRATEHLRPLPAAGTNFYPRSPCGERRGLLLHLLAGGVISIHALLAESDARAIP